MIDMNPQRALSRLLDAAQGVDVYAHLGGASVQAKEMSLDAATVRAAMGDQIISGALFDFCAWLTTRTVEIEVGASKLASPIGTALTEWAHERGLDLSQAAVVTWQESRG